MRHGGDVLQAAETAHAKAWWGGGKHVVHTTGSGEKVRCGQASLPSRCSLKSRSHVGQGLFQEAPPQPSDITPCSSQMPHAKPGWAGRSLEGTLVSSNCSGKLCGSHYTWKYPVSTPTHCTQAEL